MGARHHLVPQFYLRNFANQDRQVVLVHRDDPTRWHRSNIKNACAEVGFYRIEEDALAREEDRVDHNPEVVEEIFSKYERAAAPGIYKLSRRQDELFTREDWFHVVNFIALQTVRGNRWREDFNSIASHSVRQYLPETISDEQIREWLIEEKLPHRTSDIAAYRRKMMGESGVRLTAPQSILIQEGLRMSLDIAERLADRMDWTLIEPQQVPVLTSDEPVCWWAPGDGPIGYGNAKIVWLPLSRNLILQLRNADETQESLNLPVLDYIDGHEALASLVNRMVAGQAERWIVHHPDDHPLHNIEIPPRTRWRNELLRVVQEGSVVREHYIHRRLPPRAH